MPQIWPNALPALRKELKKAPLANTTHNIAISNLRIKQSQVIIPASEGNYKQFQCVTNGHFGALTSWYLQLCNKDK